MENKYTNPICQFPVIKGSADKCNNEARWYDKYGLVFCDTHKTGGGTLTKRTAARSTENYTVTITEPRLTKTEGK